MSQVNRGTVLRSLLWKFLERCSVQLVSFIVTILLARILYPEEYGIIALVMIFVNLAQVIVDAGFSSALIQKKNATLSDFSTIFYTNLAMALVLYVILYFSAHAIATFYDKPQLINIVRILSLSLFFYAINSVQRAYLVRNLLFKQQFYSSFGAVIFSGALGITMALKGFGVWALVAQSFGFQIANVAIMWITVPWRPTFEFSRAQFKELFDFGWKIFASSMLINLFINIRGLIIGKVYSARSLALFDRGKQMPSLIIDNINSSIQAVLFPVMSSMQDDKESVKAMVRRSIKTSAFLIFPLVIGMAFTAESMVKCLLTDKWLGAVPYIQIFSLAYLLMPMQIANLEAIKSLGHSGTTLRVECIKKIFELIILVITIPLGVIWIAFGVVIYNLISLFINIFPNKKYLKYGIFEQFKDISPNLILSLLMGTIIYLISFIQISPWPLFILQIITGIITYLLLNMIFKPESYRYIHAMILPHIKNFI